MFVMYLISFKVPIKLLVRFGNDNKVLLATRCVLRGSAQEDMGVKNKGYILKTLDMLIEHNYLVSFNYHLNMAYNCETYGTMKVEIYNDAGLISLI